MPKSLLIMKAAFWHQQYIYELWEAPILVQKRCGVIIGKNYPYRIVEHKEISKANMSGMKEVYDAQKAGRPMPALHPESLPIIEHQSKQADVPTTKRRRT